MSQGCHAMFIISVRYLKSSSVKQVFDTVYLKEK